MLTSEGEEHQYKFTIYQFALYICSHLEKIFFLCPSEIMNAFTRMKSIQRMAQTFNLRLPKNIFK